MMKFLKFAAFICLFYSAVNAGPALDDIDNRKIREELPISRSQINVDILVRALSEQITSRIRLLGQTTSNTIPEAINAVWIKILTSPWTPEDVSFVNSNIMTPLSVKAQDFQKNMEVSIMSTFNTLAKTVNAALVPSVTKSLAEIVPEGSPPRGSPEEGIGGESQQEAVNTFQTNMNTNIVPKLNQVLMQQKPTVINQLREGVKQNLEQVVGKEMQASEIGKQVFELLANTVVAGLGGSVDDNFKNAAQNLVNVNVPGMRGIIS